ncbi:MAG TPA: SpaA isopeptide-forming pilin-related protein, partial [Acidimicrobiales bacterium]
YPGFAYCVVEQTAPSNYVAQSTPQCTPVLAGSVAVPPVVTSLTFADSAKLITLTAHKFNSLVPDTSIPGATYDLYVEGAGPPSSAPPVPPADATVEAGDSWYARGTSDASGNLMFSIPAGYAWCLLEHSAPADYLPDPALHCSSTLTMSSPSSATTIALPETLATVYISAHKYNSLVPDTVIAGATYALFAQGAAPAGSSPPAAPAGVIVPAGQTYWGQGTTDAAGLLSFAVPSGYSWCLQELVAPAGYQPDPADHCTSVLSDDSAAATGSLALPELPVPGPGPLAFTGGPSVWLPLTGMLLVLAGLALLELKRRAERSTARVLSRALVDGVDELAQAGVVPAIESEGQPG